MLNERLVLMQTDSKKKVIRLFARQVCSNANRCDLLGSLLFSSTTSIVNSTGEESAECPLVGTQQLSEKGCPPCRQQELHPMKDHGSRRHCKDEKNF